MAYNILKSDGVTPIVIADGSVDTSFASINLVGKNHQGYGDEIAENFVWMVEHFANNSAPLNPTSGQIWWNTSGTGSLSVYDGTSFVQLLIGGDIQGHIIPSTDITWDIGTPSFRFRNVYADTFVGVATSARYADLAERYESDEPLVAGTVVKIGGEKEVTKTVDPGCKNVFGVVSTAPGLMLNSDAGDDTTHPYIALAGRVQISVHGECKKGDRLMASSHDGEAQVAPEDADYRSIIGRALEDKEDRECGLIEAVVGAK